MGELRILIADDHELIRRGVRDLLAEREGWRVVAEATNGREAVERVEELEPEIAVLDYSMPEMNGPEAAEAIGRVSPGTGVIVLTMHDSEEMIRAVLRSGARGFVLKSDADVDLVRAIEAVSEGRQFFTQRVADLILRGYLTGPGASRSERADELTAREREVLELLASGMTSREVGQRLRISTRTAEAHRTHINRKLRFSSTSDLVRYALRHGIVAA